MRLLFLGCPHGMRDGADRPSRHARRSHRDLALRLSFTRGGGLRHWSGKRTPTRRGVEVRVRPAGVAPRRVESREICSGVGCKRHRDDARDLRLAAAGLIDQRRRDLRSEGRQQRRRCRSADSTIIGAGRRAAQLCPTGSSSYAEVRQALKLKDVGPTFISARRRSTTFEASLPRRMCS